MDVTDPNAIPEPPAYSPPPSPRKFTKIEDDHLNEVKIVTYQVNYPEKLADSFTNSKSFSFLPTETWW